MSVFFVPKYSSQYNNIENEMTVQKGISFEDETKIFFPKHVEVAKRAPVQMSYESRVEREKLRTYNG